MKKSFLITICALGFQLMTGQGIAQGATINSSGIDLNLYQNSSVNIGERVAASNIEGSRFFIDGFQSGLVTILNSEQKPAAAYFQYDVYSGVMKMSLYPNGQESVYLSQARNIQVEIDNHKFRYVDYSLNGREYSSYLEVLQTLASDHILGVIHSKEIAQREVAGSSSYATTPNPKFKDVLNIVLVDKDGNAVQFDNHKKRVYSNLDDKYQDQIEDYIKKNKIKFDDDYKGVIAVAKYYASFI